MPASLSVQRPVPMIHEDEGFCHFFLWIHQSPLKTSAKAVITVIHCRKKNCWHPVPCSGFAGSPEVLY
jgi:hypothetical protein